MPPRAQAYRWNAEARRYVAPNGRFVSQAQVRRAIDATLESLGRDAAVLAERLRARTITLDAWELEMRAVIKEIHLQSAALAKGGWAQMGASDFGRVGRIVQEQYVYLSRFAAELELGEQAMDGRFLRRVRLYIQSGRRTYYRVLGAEAEDAGAGEERSVLHPADHCDECVIQATLGWQPLGSLTPIGERQCLTECHCTMEFR